MRSYDLRGVMKGKYLDSTDTRVGRVIEGMILERMEEGLEGILLQDDKEAFQFTIQPSPDIAFSPWGSGVTFSIVENDNGNGERDFIFMVSDRTRTLEGIDIPDTIIGVLTHQVHEVVPSQNTLNPPPPLRVATWYVQTGEAYAFATRRAFTSPENLPMWVKRGMDTLVYRRTGEKFFSNH